VWVSEDRQLDRPLHEQYLAFVGNLLHGDLGESVRRPGTKIADVIFPKMWVSIQENVYPFILTFGIGIPIGVYLALRRGHWQDPTVTALLLVLSAIGIFGIVLVIAVSIYQFATHGVGTTGVPPGQPVAAPVKVIASLKWSDGN